MMLRQACWLLLLLPAVAGAQTTAAAALEAAWQRSVAGRNLEAEQAVVSEARYHADLPVPDAPYLAFSQRSGGQKQEFDAEYGMQLWAPGEQQSARRRANRLNDQQTAAARAARWRLAGEVRNAWWRVRRSEAQSKVTQERLTLAQDLAKDLQRRISVGEAATADGWLAAQEVIQAQAVLLNDQREAREALSAWTLLTGLTRAPVGGERDAPAAEPHPELAELRAMLGVKFADLQKVSDVVRDRPELAVAVRAERDSGLPWQNAVVVRFKWPLTHKPHLAEPRAEHDKLLTELSRREVEIPQHIADAEQNWQTARQLADLAGAQLKHAGQLADLAEKAYRLGERSLPELLRARAGRIEARRAQEQAEVQVQQALSAWLQAKGVVPE